MPLPPPGFRQVRVRKEIMLIFAPINSMTL